MVSIFMLRAQERVRQLQYSMEKAQWQSLCMCEDCGEEISVQRMAACPDATRCTRCQEEWEEEQRRLQCMLSAQGSLRHGGAQYF